MRASLLILAATLFLTACNATQRGAAVGAGVGAAAGAIVSGTPTGAAIGATAGGLAGALIGRAAEDGKCRYKDRRGRIYIDKC
ncbi:MAG: YMGG-like glycine zipper-containing protein [Rhizobiaceae bacterium]